jgi:hypothetical protein
MGVVQERKHDVPEVQPIAHGRLTEVVEHFQGSELDDIYFSVLKLTHVELLMVLNRVPPRTPHQVLDMAVHSIAVQVDRTVELFQMIRKVCLGHHEAYRSSGVPTFVVNHPHGGDTLLIHHRLHYDVSAKIDDVAKVAHHVSREAGDRAVILLQNSSCQMSKILSKTFSKTLTLIVTFV